MHKHILLSDTKISLQRSAQLSVSDHIPLSNTSLILCIHNQHCQQCLLGHIADIPRAFPTSPQPAPHIDCLTHVLHTQDTRTPPVPIGSVRFGARWPRQYPPEETCAQVVPHSPRACQIDRKSIGRGALSVDCRVHAAVRSIGWCVK